METTSELAFGQLLASEPVQPKYNPATSPDGSGISQVAEPKLGLLIGQSKRGTEANHVCHVVTVDLDSEGFCAGHIKVPFLGHGMAMNPNFPERAALFEKRGKGACEIDLKAGRVLRTIPTAANRHFYGHGSYSKDGTILYATETVIEGDYDGVIVMRDAETFAEIGHFPSYGARPHDCRLIDDGKVMLITNGGGRVNEHNRPNVTYVDVETHQLLDKCELDNNRINSGHVAISEDGALAVVSAPREGLEHEKYNGGISIGKRNGGSLTSVVASKKVLGKLLGESLSVCIDPKNRRVAATTPLGKMVTFWNLDNGNLEHQIKLKKPTGVTLTQDGKFFAISHGEIEPVTTLIDVDTFEPLAGYELYASMSGSHLVSYNLPAHLRG